MTKIRAIALFVAVAGSLLYLKTVYFSPAKNWEDYNQAGVAAYGKKDYTEAEIQLAAALKEAEKFPLNDRRLYFGLSQLAEIYRIQSKFMEAEGVLKRILSIDEKKFGPAHPNVAFGLNNLAGIYRVQGKYKEAEALLKRALIILEESFGKDHELVGNIIEHYSRLLHKMGRAVEATKMKRRYTEIYSN